MGLSTIKIRLCTLGYLLIDLRCLRRLELRLHSGRGKTLGSLAVPVSHQGSLCIWHRHGCRWAVTLSMLLLSLFLLGFLPSFSLMPREHFDAKKKKNKNGTTPATCLHCAGNCQSGCPDLSWESQPQTLFLTTLYSALKHAATEKLCLPSEWTGAVYLSFHFTLEWLVSHLQGRVERSLAVSAS